MIPFVRSDRAGGARDAGPARPALRSEALRLSVVIPSGRRPELLCRCLAAVFAQAIDAGAFEVIVVDDGHGHDPQPVVEAFRQRPDAPLLRLVRPRQGSGPAVARNAGWRAAFGRIVVFTTADAVPTPDWLARGERALAPELVAVCGRIVASLAGEPAAAGDATTAGAVSAASRSPGGLASANAFVRRSALLAVGGFDERFRGAGTADSDLHARLVRDAGPVGCSDETVVQQRKRPPRWRGWLRQQEDGFFDALLYKKHPHLLRERPEAAPPWSHYGIVALTLAAALLWLAGIPGSALVSLLLAGAGVVRLAIRQRRQRALRAHPLGSLLAAAVIPFLSVYWRLRGAIHFRVLFL